MNKKEKIKIALKRHFGFQNSNVLSIILKNENGKIDNTNFEFSIVNVSTNKSIYFYESKNSENLNIIPEKLNEECKTLTHILEVKDDKLKNKYLDFTLVLILPYNEFNVKYIKNQFMITSLYAKNEESIKIGFFDLNSQNLIYRSDFFDGYKDSSSGFFD